MTGLLPRGWDTAPINDVIAIQDDGKTIHQGWSPQCEKAPCVNDLDWGVLKTTSIQSGEFQYQHHKRLPDVLEPKPAIEVRVGDILLTCAGPRVRCGVACLVRTTRARLMLSGKMYRFRAVSGATDARYLESFLQSDAAQIEIDRMKTGGSDSGLNLTHDRFKHLGVPVAPYREQTRIADKLEELFCDLDAGVAELKAAQKKLTQYRQSLLKAAVEGALTAEWRKHNQPAESGAHLLERILKERRARWQAKQLAKFKEQGKTPPKDWQDKYPEPVKPDTTNLPTLPEGWVWASVDQIASDEQYSLSIGPFGSNLKVSDYRDSGVPLVFVRNIRSGRYGGSNTQFVASDKADELKAHATQAGDVLITKMGEPPGDADVYPADQPPAIITADCIKVRCWPALMEAQFLATVINSNIGKSQIVPMTQGVAQKKVSLGRFSTLAVPLPSHSEQVAIVEMLGTSMSDAARQGDAIALSLKQSTAQRKNILKAAFSGQLVPQDPNDEPASVLLARIRAERAAVTLKAVRSVARRKAPQ